MTLASKATVALVGAILGVRATPAFAGGVAATAVNGESAAVAVQLTGQVTSAIVISVTTESRDSAIARGEGSRLSVGPFRADATGIASRMVPEGRELSISFAVEVHQSALPCSTIWAHVAPGATLPGSVAVALGGEPARQIGPEARPLATVGRPHASLPGRLMLQVPRGKETATVRADVIFEATPSCESSVR